MDRPGIQGGSAPGAWEPHLPAPPGEAESRLSRRPGCCERGEGSWLKVALGHIPPGTAEGGLTHSSVLGRADEGDSGGAGWLGLRTGKGNSGNTAVLMDNEPLASPLCLVCWDVAPGDRVSPCPTGTHHSGWTRDLLGAYKNFRTENEQTVLADIRHFKILSKSSYLVQNRHLETQVLMTGPVTALAGPTCRTASQPGTRQCHPFLSR